MLIWKGNGVAVPLITAGSLIALDYITGQENGAGYYAAHFWPKLVAFAIAAIATFFLARANDNAGREDDHFFFVPLRFWPIILVVGGVILSIATTTDATTAPPAEVAKQETVESQSAASVPPPAPAPATTATYVAPPPPRRAEPAPAPEPELKKFAQVYIDSQTRTYFPETCSAHPATATLVAKSVAVVQGYTLSPNCK